MPKYTTMPAVNLEPPVLIDAAYLKRLEGLAVGAYRRSPAIAARLMDEIDRADVRASSDIPSNVITIGSDVLFRDDAKDWVQSVVLVLPADADIARRRISVLTPIGVALIGLAEGASITWESLDGKSRQLTVIRVSPPCAAPKADVS